MASDPHQRAALAMPRAVTVRDTSETLLLMGRSLVTLPLPIPSLNCKDDQAQREGNL